MTRIGVVGLGNMGAGIARCLDRAGVLHAAIDTKPNQRATIGLSDTVGCAVEEAEVLLFVTPSTAQVADVAEANPHLANQVFVDLTTSHPEDSIALAGQLSARGIDYVDAAMTGGAAGADAGKLTLMMGGDADVIARIAPVLDHISEQRFHLGAVGAGHTMKLVHNQILHSAFLGTCEGLTLAAKAGLDVAQAVDVLNAGNARSFVTEVRFPRDILGGVMNGRSQIANLEKDLGLARRFADALGGPSVYTDLTHDVLKTAVDQGDAATDFTYLFPMFEDLAKAARDD